MNLLGRKMVGEVFYLRETSVPDEKNDCPFNTVFGTFLSRQKGFLKFLFPISR